MNKNQAIIENNVDKKQRILREYIFDFFSKSLILNEIAALIYDLFEDQGIHPDYVSGIYPMLLQKLNTHIKKINPDLIPSIIRQCSFVTEQQLEEYKSLYSDIKKQIEEQIKEQKKISELSPPNNCYTIGKFESQFEPLLMKAAKIEEWWKILYRNSS